jgi:hypothetical protein
MIGRFSFSLVLAHCLLLTMACAAQTPGSANKTKLDGLLARAEQGDAGAQLQLGRAYLGEAFQTGVTVRPDTSEALRWFLQAAKQNNTDALLELGMGYEYGLFGSKDAIKAVEYYRQAADLGDTSAKVDLIHLYVEGADGLPQNFDEAAQLANCPKPSSATMQSCQSITRGQLPKPALALLHRLKCDAGPNYDYGAEIHLRAGTDLPYYEVCCHDAPHGPCSAVLVGEVAGKWVNLADQVGLLGFDTTCGGIMVLESMHAEIHDLCLPDERSDPNSVRCRPMVLQFDGARYVSVPASSESGPKHR